ncbi:MAG: DUF368 domain-containing protein [Oscillospiraceae bacterium]|nr:DUF368 domain-containing protein [Oscillospiraceae bacterium]
MKILNHLQNFIYGAIFGMAIVIPGFSGSTMMVVLGCYDKVCAAFALDFKFIRRNLGFLFPFGIGVVVGIFGLFSVMAWLLENHAVPTCMFFMGLIAGSFSVISKELPSVRERQLKAYHVLLGVAALAAVVLMIFAQDSMVDDTAVAITNPLWLFVCGFAAAAAMIIPGISGAFVLVMLGAYQTIAEAASFGGLNFAVLVPAGIGVIAGLVLGARAIRYLLAKYRKGVYCVIAGLVVGSFYVIFMMIVNEIYFDLSLVMGTVAFAIGVGASYFAGAVKN